MKILVTGANGQLGNEMRILASKDAVNSFVFTDVVEVPGVETTLLDITDAAAVKRIVMEQGIEAIVNCAAYTNVDAAEGNEALAMKLNADAPGILAAAAAEAGAILVHISTDYVFGKEPYNTPCREDQTGTPTGVYGMTKKVGEEKILASGCSYLIIRTAWLYSEFGKNFCRTMLNLTATRPSLNVVFDQVGTPTYALDLAQAIMHMLSDRDKALANCGIYHYSNEGVCSWYDFTQMIARMSGNTACDVQPCHSDEFPSPVRRPSFSVLDKTKIKKVFGVEVPYWTDSLQKCIENLTE